MAEEKPKVLITGVKIVSPKATEIREDFLLELEGLGVHYNKETQMLEMTDLTKIPLMFALFEQINNLKTLDDLNSFLRSALREMQESH